MQSNVLFNYLPNSILRNSIRMYARRRLQNPGLQKRINLLSEKQESNQFDEEDLEQLETDFMNTDKVHRLHESEIEKLRDKEKFRIVRRKYFKEEHVNFLTWNDKEQIRYLHGVNPNEWTIEKLSDGFPALPHTISKILKGKWQPENNNRKKNHDLHVENNWKLFKEGKLNNLPPDVMQHISKFSDRKPRFDIIDEKIVIKQPNTIESTPGEYGSIIANYNKLVNRNNGTTVNQKDNVENIVDNNINIEEPLKQFRSDRQNNRMTTLSELRKKIAKAVDSGKNVDDYDKMILKETVKNEEKNTLDPTFKFNSLGTYKIETSNKLVDNENKKALESLKYPERIVIPKEKFKKGFTYKVNDCYYDDDGDFLYRVPGMY